MGRSWRALISNAGRSGLVIKQVCCDVARHLSGAVYAASGARGPVLSSLHCAPPDTATTAQGSALAAWYPARQKAVFVKCRGISKIGVGWRAADAPNQEVYGTRQ